MRSTAVMSRSSQRRQYIESSASLALQVRVEPRSEAEEAVRLQAQVTILAGSTQFQIDIASGTRMVDRYKPLARWCIDMVQRRGADLEVARGARVAHVVDRRAGDARQEIVADQNSSAATCTLLWYEFAEL